MVSTADDRITVLLNDFFPPAELGRRSQEYMLACLTIESVEVFTRIANEWKHLSDEVKKRVLHHFVVNELANGTVVVGWL